MFSLDVIRRMNRQQVVKEQAEVAEDTAALHRAFKRYQADSKDPETCQALAETIEEATEGILRQC